MRAGSPSPPRPPSSPWPHGHPTRSTCPHEAVSCPYRLTCMCSLCAQLHGQVSSVLTYASQPLTSPTSRYVT